jgi:hypothetical protein
MRKYLLVSLAMSLLFLSNVYGQEKAQDQLTPRAGHPREDPSVCADGRGQASSTQRGTHRFRQLGETIEIPLRGDSVPASVADCEPVALDLHWTNGRNNGGNFNVTFLDSNNRPIYARQITAFMTGVLQLPLSSFDAQPVFGSSLAMVNIPITVTIQAVKPFAAPANLSYTVTRVPRASNRREQKEEREKAEAVEAQKAEDRRAEHSWGAGQANEIVSIHNAVRLIGASRLPVIQIELKTSRPFPVRDVPLQLQIGEKIFLDELSGDYTGRKLTLSLTPEMFAELKDGDEIVAFFSKPFAEGDVWYFGKLNKSSGGKQ